MGMIIYRRIATKIECSARMSASPAAVTGQKT